MEKSTASGWYGYFGNPTRPGFYELPVHHQGVEKCEEPASFPAARRISNSGQRSNVMQRDN
jgi:hypothetical protein